eukprot:6189113-Pleurochrysis_carterae.AAC.1
MLKRVARNSRHEAHSQPVHILQLVSTTRSCTALMSRRGTARTFATATPLRLRCWDQTAQKARWGPP